MATLGFNPTYKSCIYKLGGTVPSRARRQPLSPWRGFGVAAGRGRDRQPINRQATGPYRLQS